MTTHYSLKVLFFSFTVLWLTACGDMVATDEDPDDIVSASFGKQYQVWGGPAGDMDCYDPAGHGYTLLGENFQTAEFIGQYEQYVIFAERYNHARVDAIEDSDNNYYETYWTCNTVDYENISGPPDGNYAIVNENYTSYNSKGSFIITAEMQSIKVHIAQ